MIKLSRNYEEKGSVGFGLDSPLRQWRCKCRISVRLEKVVKVVIPPSECGWESGPNGVIGVVSGGDQNEKRREVRQEFCTQVYQTDFTIQVNIVRR